MLDADIYGPNVPTMMGVRQQPQPGSGGKIRPLERYGVALMSVGFLGGSEKAVIWRGPLVAKMVRRFLLDVAWERLDYLLVDLPPGTGDAQLTLCQAVALSGGVIVSTPQDVALEDALKGIDLFRTVGVPVLGLIENMSYFCCPHCGERTEIFAHGGARRACERYQVPFLGEIPLEPAIRIGGDSGVPVVVAAPESAQAQAFKDIARRLQAQVQRHAAARPRSLIVE
ncbi:MAG: hypothetical protein KatS3mg131_3017 [Candidatus Tectimicrobiota bacterium]|nr:MAG: hypothetical protein KatS3mg131_3017 [Candidatus Tectomicrobia bacterium]